jgi:hypothetical protein
MYFLLGLLTGALVEEERAFSNKEFALFFWGMHSFFHLNLLALPLVKNKKRASNCYAIQRSFFYTCL